ncbi:MAG: hypothetical protein HC851_19115 [Acaryochloris sp. RU_4_1]|nr:hypothetical protein [Acaryochloris sp. RU_4_1]
MRNPNHYRFRLDTVWGKDKEIATVIKTAKAHYQRSFGGKCVTILYAVFKPIAVALQTNSATEVRKAIEVSRDQLETFYNLALVSVSSEETHLPNLALEEAPPPLPTNTETIQPTCEPYDPPREKTLKINSAGSALNLYEGFEEDG